MSKVLFAIPLKRCPGCKIEYPATAEYFHRNRGEKSGLMPRCKKCRSAEASARRAKASGGITKAERDSLRASGLKRCPKCKKAFPIGTDHFFRSKRFKDGYGPYCKECAKRWYVDNAIRVKEYQQRYYHANHERMLEKAKETRRKNLQRHSSYCRDYYAEHRQRILEQKRDYARRNHDKLKNTWRARRAREMGASGHHTAEDVALIRKSQNGRCWWCGKKIVGMGHIDHIQPLARGGTNNANNLCLSCAKCNISKGAKLPSEFAGRLF